LCDSLLATLLYLVDPHFHFLDKIKLVRNRSIRRRLHGALELFDIRGRQVRPIDLDRQRIRRS
jgi:hypothetical protein